MSPTFYIQNIYQIFEIFHMIEIHYQYHLFLYIYIKEFSQKLIREILISGYISYLITLISFHFLNFPVN